MPRPKQKTFPSSQSSQEIKTSSGKLAIKTITINDRRAKRAPQRRITPEIKQMIAKRQQKVKVAPKFCIPKTSFQRIVRDTLRSRHLDYKIQSDALFALQEMSEIFLMELFENANLCTMHAKRTTLMAKDLYLALKLRNMRDFLPK